MALILLIKQTNTTNEHFCESNIHASGVKHSLIYLAFRWLQHSFTTGLPRGNSRFKSKLYRVPFGISLFIPSFPFPFSFLHFLPSPYLSTPPTHIFFFGLFFPSFFSSYHPFLSNFSPSFISLPLFPPPFFFYSFFPFLSSPPFLLLCFSF